MCNDSLKQYAIAFGATCPYCGKSLSQGEVNAEHIILASRGGSKKKSNILITHSICNTKRGHKSLRTFLNKSRVNYIYKYLIDFKGFLYYDNKDGRVVNYSTKVYMTLIQELGGYLCHLK